MNRLVVFGILLLVFVLGASASENRIFAQDEIAGGYGEMSIKDKDVRKSANLAVRLHSKKVRANYSLVSIRKAEVQVVAGLNYRICIRVRDNRGRRSTVTAVVYKDLRNRYSLTRWRNGGCSDLP